MSERLSMIAAFCAIAAAVLWLIAALIQPAPRGDAFGSAGMPAQQRFKAASVRKTKLNGAAVALAIVSGALGGLRPS